MKNSIEKQKMKCITAKMSKMIYSKKHNLKLTFLVIALQLLFTSTYAQAVYEDERYVQEKDPLVRQVYLSLGNFPVWSFEKTELIDTGIKRH